MGSFGGVSYIDDGSVDDWYEPEFVNNDMQLEQTQYDAGFGTPLNLTINNRPDYPGPPPPPVGVPIADAVMLDNAPMVQQQMERLNTIREVIIKSAK